MPNLPAHIDLAFEAARRVNHPALDADLGHYLLGCTSPDVRAITKRSREEYHFATLGVSLVGEGPKGLFEAHPNLMGGSVKSPTRAFVAGYITHLLLDEAWILEFYRPYFGNTNVYNDVIQGKIADRALQLELDLLSMPTASSVIHLIAKAQSPIDITFIAPDILVKWHKFIIDLVNRDFTWERLRFMANRIAAGEANHPAHRLADEFLAAMPESRECLLQIVSPNALEEFRNSAINRMANAVMEYLE